MGRPDVALVVIGRNLRGFWLFVDCAAAGHTLSNLVLPGCGFS